MKGQSTTIADETAMKRELEEQLRRIESEDVPERLLELARQLQDQLRKRGAVEG